MLGDLNLTSTKDDAKPAIYSIVKSHYSSIDFKVSTIYENLALYELNTTVVFSSYIRPACLHTLSSSSVEIDTKGVISGWGWGPTTTGTSKKYSKHFYQSSFIDKLILEMIGVSTGDRSNEHLLKAALTVVDNKRCERLYNPNGTAKLGEELKNGFQKETMICAGDFTEGEALCAVSKVSYPVILQAYIQVQTNLSGYVPLIHLQLSVTHKKFVIFSYIYLLF